MKTRDQMTPAELEAAMAAYRKRNDLEEIRLRGAAGAKDIRGPVTQQIPLEAVRPPAEQLGSGIPSRNAMGSPGLLSPDQQPYAPYGPTDYKQDVQVEKVKRPAYLNDKAIEKMFEDIGVNLDTTDVSSFLDRVAEVESNGDVKAANKNSSARGMYQWLTKQDAKTGESAFQEDLMAARIYYKKFTGEVPKWVTEAYKDNDPTDLSANNQKKLFMFRMYRLGKNADLKRAYEGNTDAQKQLYYDKHHTAPDQATKDRVEKVWGSDGNTSLLDRLLGDSGPQGGQPVNAAAQIPLEGTVGNFSPPVYTGAPVADASTGQPLDVWRNSPYRFDKRMFDL